VTIAQKDLINLRTGQHDRRGREDQMADAIGDVLFHSWVCCSIHSLLQVVSKYN